MTEGISGGVYEVDRLWISTDPSTYENLVPVPRARGVVRATRFAVAAAFTKKIEESCGARRKKWQRERL